MRRRREVSARLLLAILRRVDGGPTSFFVYGTLRRGQRFFQRFAGDVSTVTLATMTATLYDLPRRGYPIAVDSGVDTIMGEIMVFPDPVKTLARLDRLEGYDPGKPEAGEYTRYVREAMPLDGAAPVPCWVYLATQRQFATLKDEAILIPGGDWLAHQAKDRVS